MSWQQPSPSSSFLQPYATHRSSKPVQNKTSDSGRPQDGLPPRRGGYPPVHNYSVSPSQVYYSSQQPPPFPSRRSTYPTAPTHEHAPSFPRQPAPPPSGSVSLSQSFPVRCASISSSCPPPPMTQHAATMPMPVHPNIAPSMPYDMSLHPPSRSEMSGGPHPSSQTWTHLDVDEGEDDSSDPSDGDLEQSPEGKGDFQRRSEPYFPFASRKSHGRRRGKGSPSGSPASDQLPCRLCRKLNPRHVIERWGGFCCERHKTQWMLYEQRQ